MKSSVTTRGKRAPILPELDGVSDKEWSAIYNAGTEIAFRCLGNKGDAFEAVNGAALALCSTHRYDEAKHKNLRRHFLNLVRGECQTFLTHRRRENDACHRMHESNDDDSIAHEQGQLSPEAMMIQREEDERYEVSLQRTRARLRKLQRCVAYNPAAVALLEYWAANGDDRPMPQIAAAIGYELDDVYEAKKLIERKAEKILGEDEEGEDQ